MKKIIFTLLTFCVLYFNSNAQYCGNSGSIICTPSGTLTISGLDPVSDSLGPFVVGVDTNVTIQFKNFDSIPNPAVPGTKVKIDSLTIDTISNLPTGLCWATNKDNNTFSNLESGCIRISGIPTAAPGQYRLKIKVKVHIFPAHIPADAASAGLFYYVRLNAAGDTTVRAVDTTGQSAGNNYFKAYTSVGIRDVSAPVTKLGIAPNPFNNKTAVSFYSEREMVMTERITSIIGNEISKKQLDIKAGENTSVLERGTLPAGVYFYSLSDGRFSITKRIVIAD